MNLTILLIICLIVHQKCETHAETATCQYTEKNIIIDMFMYSKYSCELSFNNLKTFDSVTNIDGDHEDGNTDGNVKILESSSPAEINEFSSTFCEKFPNLESLKLENVKINSIDDISLQNCQYLKILSLNNNEIREIPQRLFSENSELLEIAITSNQLETLHDETFELQDNLKNLILSNNKISSLPSGIFKSLWGLHTLNLDENQIEILDPTWFRKLTSLVKLSLKSNFIYDLPQEIFSNLNDLQVLELNSNHLTVINSNSFPSQGSLLTVDLSFNKIDAIDSNFIKNSPITTLVMENVSCFQASLVFRDEMDVKLQNCYDNFKEGRYKITKINRTTTTSTSTTTLRPSSPKSIKTVPITTSSSPVSSSTVALKLQLMELEETTTTLVPPIEIKMPPKKCGKALDRFGKPKANSTQFPHGAYPWIAGVLKKDVYHCGGVLVSNMKVVTAARCMYQNDKNTQKKVLERDLKVVLGSQSLFEKFERGKSTKGVLVIHIHPEFSINSPTSDADIAVLILNDKVSLTTPFVKLICMMDPNINLVSVTDGVVVSYGQSTGYESAIIPRQIQTKINENKDCSISLDVASSRTFCGGQWNAFGVCNEDLGSGLFVKYDDHFYLRGIVSTVVGINNGICDQNSKSIFTDISMFTKWIEDAPIEVVEEIYTDID